MEIVLNEYGHYLGTKNSDNLAIFNSGTLKKTVPISKVDSVFITEGNSISSDTLTLCGLYNVPLFVLSRSGKIMSTNLPFSENRELRVESRLAQYKSITTEKGTHIAKNIVLAKMNNQKMLLQKHGYKLNISTLEKQVKRVKGKFNQDIRTKLYSLEGRASKGYFSKYFNLLPSTFKTEKRYKHRAKDRVNNLLNIGYEILKTEICKGIMLAHLDPFIGYNHSVQYLKPSLICDIQEIFRCFIDDFIISYILRLDPIDSFEQQGTRWFLTPKETKKFIIELNKLFDSQIEHQRIKKFGKKAKIRTIIKEEPIKLAQYLRDEKPGYLPFLLI